MMSHSNRLSSLTEARLLSRSAEISWLAYIVGTGEDLGLFFVWTGGGDAALPSYIRDKLDITLPV
jgi:hypothetical protein